MTSSERYHSLDSLRAIMMLLGVLLHIVCGYAIIDGVWWYKDSATSRVADIFILFLHIFRLPVFFVMAGFLGALLYTKRGWTGFAKNRASRIILPLVLFQLILYPLLEGISGYRWAVEHDETNPIMGAFHWISSARCWSRIHPMHLWFLEYLALTCLVTAVAAPLLSKICGRRASAWFRAAVTSSWRAVIFAVPTLATLAFMHDGLLDTPHSFVPEVRILAAYTVFFGFGWILYHHRDLLGELTRGVGVQLTAAMLFSAANALFLVRRIEHHADPVAFWGLAVTGSVVVWLMIFGSTGFFIRHFSQPSPTMRYLSDSAYWQYLMHPPIVFAAQLAVAPLAVAWYLKAALVTAVSVPLLLVSYEWFVRHTWVGVILNGRRYAKVLPTPFGRSTEKPEMEAAG